MHVGVAVHIHAVFVLRCVSIGREVRHVRGESESLSSLLSALSEPVSVSAAIAAAIVSCCSAALLLLSLRLLDARSLSLSLLFEARSLARCFLDMRSLCLLDARWSPPPFLLLLVVVLTLPSSVESCGLLELMDDA